MSYKNTVARLLCMAVVALAIPAWGKAARTKGVRASLPESKKINSAPRTQPKRTPRSPASKDSDAFKRRKNRTRIASVTPRPPVAGVPVFATTRSQSKKPAPPVRFSPTSASREPSDINFNGIINHARKNQSRLEKRMKVRTAVVASQAPVAKSAGTNNHPGSDMDNGDVKFKRLGRPVPKQTAERTAVAPGGSVSRAPFTLSLRSKRN